MEYVVGTNLRHIFLHNGNWWKLFLKHRNLIRKSIVINVLKFLACRTSLLGYHYFICPFCKHSLKVPHSCKSRLCPSCGKKATDNWIKSRFNTLPRTIWQHITFTLPDSLWKLIVFNPSILNKIPLLAAHIIIQLSKSKGFLPGIFLAIHTFGRDLKNNPHFHLSTPIGETRIKSYDGSSVTFEYLDHYTDSYDILTLPVLEFLARLVSHIPEKNFRNIRYYGFLSNRLSSKLLPTVYKLLNMKNVISKKVFTSWRDLMKNAFHRDPLICPFCKTIMRLSHIRLPQKIPLLSIHKEIAHGFFQEFCVHCCKGLIIPVNFTDKHGNNYSFHELKPKLSLPDDETILKRIIQFRNDIGDPIFFG